MEVIRKSIQDLTPYANNPRNNDEAVKYVAESIKQCGYIAPIIVDENNEILAGHTRLRVLKKLGYKEVDVIVRTGLTEEQKRKYRILDNKTSEYASWDLEKLEEEIEGLDFEGLDIDWGLPEEEPEIKEDNFEPVIPNKTYVQRGDIYQLGTHRLMCGDSTNDDDVMKLMNDNVADLVVTDPPYNVAVSNSKGMRIENDDMSSEAFRDFLRKAFSQIKTHLREGGGILHLVCIQGAYEL